MKWQKTARLVIAAATVAFAIIVALAFGRRPAVPSSLPARSDPSAVIESTGGRVQRFKSSREDVRVEYEKQLTYADNSTKLVGVTVATAARAGGRSFTVTAKEGTVAQNESSIVLTGDVRLVGSDGFTARTERATYADKDGIVRAAGPMAFSRGRLTGSGVGMTYATGTDELTILDQAVVHVAPDGQGADRVEIAARTAAIGRRTHTMRFEGQVRLERGGRQIDADAATAHLTEDNARIEAMELRGHSAIVVDTPMPGALQRLSARDIDLAYGADGQTIEHALLTEDSAIVVAGAAGAAGRQIAATTIDVTLAPDGSPVALTARDAVRLTLPADAEAPARTIRAAAMQSHGEAGRGLTGATFTGGVQYRERGRGIDRSATAATLEVALAPAMSGIDEATFTHGVCFTDGGAPAGGGCATRGGTAALAAAARYDLGKGLLALSGSEPSAARPHVVDDQIAVDASRIDLTLQGPKLAAKGEVKSVIQVKPAGQTDEHLPALFKPDKPLNVTADALDYDGTADQAVYTGNAQLWQDETSIKGATLVLDDRRGDLTGEGGDGVVTTVTVRDELDKDKKTVRVRSLAKAKHFRYRDAGRTATYTGEAHMSSPDGDLTAAKIELYLKPSGDEVERAEAYDQVTLHDQNRTTTGNRLTYTTADQQYVVLGTPVKIVDECKRVTTGRTLTYLRDADVITIDGNDQIRTETRGAGQCP